MKTPFTPYFSLPIEEKEPNSIVYSIYNKISKMRYIGKTKYTFRKRYPSGAWWKYTKNKLLKQDILKYGLEVFELEILESGYTEQEILVLEQLYIYSFNSFYPNGYNLSYDTDPLNHSANGKLYIAKLKEDAIYVFLKQEGDKTLNFYLSNQFGRECSQETRKKISESNKNKIISEESKQKMSESRRKYVQSQELIDKRNEIIKAKLSHPVIQIDIKNQNIIREFPSVVEAQRSIGLKSSFGIRSVCKGTQETAGGFFWKYKNKL